MLMFLASNMNMRVNLFVQQLNFVGQVCTEEQAKSLAKAVKELLGLYGAAAAAASADPLSVIAEAEFNFHNPVAVLPA